MKKIFRKRTGVQSVLALILCMVLCMATGCGQTQTVISSETNASETTAAENSQETTESAKYDVDIYTRSTASVDPNEGARPEALDGTTSFRVMSFNVQPGT